MSGPTSSRRPTRGARRERRPTWYDLLDVARDASADEIRAAWRAAIADLEPGDRRFTRLNQAAEVLLDPTARAAYDAELAATEPRTSRAGRPSADRDRAEARPSLVAERAEPPATRRPRRGVPGWLLAGLALVAAGLVAATLWMWIAGDDAGGDDAAARRAQVAAERAVVPVLSYDYETLDEDQQAAQALMTATTARSTTSSSRCIEENAPQTETKVDRRR